MLLLGVHGISVDAGFTTPNLLEGETDQALVASAERVVVVADHTKWGVRGLSRIARASRRSTCSSRTPDSSADARGVLAEHIDELIVARVQRARPARDGSPGAVVA